MGRRHAIDRAPVRLHIPHSLFPKNVDYVVLESSQVNPVFPPGSHQDLTSFHAEADAAFTSGGKSKFNKFADGPGPLLGLDSHLGLACDEAAQDDPEYEGMRVPFVLVRGLLEEQNFVDFH